MDMYFSWLENEADNFGVAGSSPALSTKTACSSVGLEHFSDKEGVAGSSPAMPTKETNGRVAQWLAQEAYIFKVGGSSPSSATKTFLEKSRIIKKNYLWEKILSLIL